MLEAMIKRMTAVKYSGVRRPTDNPFCATISATSPRVIIPTPIFKLSGNENLQALAIRPQPMIFVTSATRTKAAENKRMEPFKWSTLVLKPMLVKNTGPKII